MLEKIIGEDVKYETAKRLVSLCGVFGHQEYFKKELWRKCDGYEHEDTSEIIAYFMIVQCKNMGIYLAPVGCSWASKVSKEDCEKYLESKKDLWNHYCDWCGIQR